MEKIQIWKNLSNLYQVSKTLRFELKPIGNTLKNIKEIGLIEEDKQRSKDFQEVKIIMDKYYSYFIETGLSKVKINSDLLNEYEKIYFNFKKDKFNDKLKKEFEKIQKEIKKDIESQIKNINYFKELFTKDFIGKVLRVFLSSKNNLEDKEKVLKFEKWNTYFTGFYFNRKNVFSLDNIPTSIYYRIVNENLPKFLENIYNLNKLKEFKDFDFSIIETNFKEELNNMSLNLFFKLENFSNLLNQKGIDKINLIIGGQSLDTKNRKKGLNELINLYSQQEKDKNKSKNIRKLKLNLLYKQILSNVESHSFKFETINNEEEVISKIDDLEKKLNFNNLKDKLIILFKNLNEFNLKEIYIEKKAISKISQFLFKDYNKLDEALLKFAQVNLTNLKGKKEEKFEKWVKNTKYFSISELEEGIRLLNIINDMDEKDKENLNEVFGKENLNNLVSSYFYILLMEENKKGFFENIENSKKYYDKIKNCFNNKNKPEHTKIIKEYLDSLLNLFHFIKPFYIKQINDKKEVVVLEKDNDFYHDFEKIYSLLEEIIPIYNQVRNFVTKKKFETKKFKLNFQKPNLLNGFVESNTEKSKNGTQYSGYLFRKYNKKFKVYEYFLGISLNTQLFNFDKKINLENRSDFERLNYYQPKSTTIYGSSYFSDDNKSYTEHKKIFINYITNFLKKEELSNFIEEDTLITPTSYLNKIKEKNILIYKKLKLNKDIKFIEEKIIINLKNILIKNPKFNKYNINEKIFISLEEINNFIKVLSKNKLFKYKSISEDEFKLSINDKKKPLFLFRIHNKDLSFTKYRDETKRGRDNLHTLYFKQLMSANQNIFDLGNAEIFYREKSFPLKITHPRNIDIENKDPINNKNKSKFNYDLIKNKKYTEDKFLFHLSTKINYLEIENGHINNKVNEIIKENSKDINILSIDRGERHLAYWTLLNPNGEILKQGSFNIIADDFNRKVNYHKKLDNSEESRKKARVSWEKIENIKELKQGYLSQVVHQICKLVVKNNAIVVFEELNFGFKRGRFKIEKQVYQKFEKMLIDKLNYLVFKDRKNNEIGSSLNAYQLTSKFESFKKLGKQSGVIFYVDANYTSKICPKTGFINKICPKYENLNQAKNLIKKFNYIKFNEKENLFEFNFYYSNFGLKDLVKNNWSIFSNGIKIKNFRDKNLNNQWNSKEINVNENLMNLFNKYNINYKFENLIDEILKINETSFFRDLVFNLKLIVQLRNSKINSTEDKDDYILSCIKDKNGNFFDSRKAKENESLNADSNGAYNIGIKGMIVINRIKNNFNLDKKKNKLDLKVSRDDFINYVIDRNK